MPGSREEAEACGPRTENGRECSPRTISAISGAVMPDAVSGFSAMPGWFRVPSVFLPSYKLFYWNANAEANARCGLFYGVNEAKEHQGFSASAGHKLRGKVG